MLMNVKKGSDMSKRFTACVISLLLVFTVSACSSTPDSKEADSNDQKTAVTEIEKESEQDVDDVVLEEDEGEEEIIEHIDPSAYSVLLGFFSSLTPETTYDEIVSFCDEHGVFYRREDYSRGIFELKIAMDKDATPIKYCRKTAENIFFAFAEDGTLRYAVYSGDVGTFIKMLFYCQGNVFGWSDYETGQQWFYETTDGTFGCDSPDEAIDYAFHAAEQLKQ